MFICNVTPHEQVKLKVLLSGDQLIITDVSTIALAFHKCILIRSIFAGIKHMSLPYINFHTYSYCLVMLNIQNVYSLALAVKLEKWIIQFCKVNDPTVFRRLSRVRIIRMYQSKE